MDIKSVILCMIGIHKDQLKGELGGITRLQKLLYLLDVEEISHQQRGKFEFKPYKAGPYSSKLYDELEFLENLGFIKGEIIGDSTFEESVEVDALNFEDLMGPSDKTPVFSDAYVERSFKLTQKGKEKVEELLQTHDYKPVIDKIRKIKSRFGNYSLKDLLYYVYKKYPKMTVESEIRDQVLKRGL